MVHKFKFFMYQFKTYAVKTQAKIWFIVLVTTTNSKRNEVKNVEQSAYLISLNYDRQQLHILHPGIFK